MTSSPALAVGDRVTFTGYGFGVSRDDLSRTAEVLGFVRGRVQVRTAGLDGRIFTARLDMLRLAR